VINYYRNILYVYKIIKKILAKFPEFAKLNMKGRVADNNFNQRWNNRVP